MKLVKFVILCFCIALSKAGAFVVTTQSGFDKAVTTSDGNPIPNGGGFVAVGYFAEISDTDITSAITSADLATSFRLYGTSGVVGFGGFGGVYDIEVDGGRLAASSEFVNQSIYTIVGNGSNISNSTEFIIYKSGELFQADISDPTPKSVSVVLGVDGSYLLGGPTGGIVQIGGFDFPEIRATVVAIPEPSGILLGVIGTLGLLRRRR